MFAFNLTFAVRTDASVTAPVAFIPAAQVDSEGVFLNQITKAAPPLPALKLCDAPEFGKTTELSRAQVNALIAAAAPDLATTNWNGAESIRISRRTRTFGETAMLNLLIATLQRDCVKDKGELELSLARPWTEVNLPDEPLTLKILELPTAGVTAGFITRFEIRTAREGLGIWQATLKAHIWREVWVAKSPIRRSENLGTADLTRERRDVLPVREALADFVTPDSSLEFSEPIQSGGILLNRALKPRNVVRRGQLAQAVLRDGPLSITMKVELLEDGAPGQIVRARNPLTRRDVSGKVLNDQTLLITL